MFYATAAAFFPVFLVFIVPLGLALTSLFRGREDADDIGTALVPVIGLAALITLISGLLHLGLPAKLLLPLVLAVNFGAAFLARNRRAARPPRLLLILLLSYLAYLILISPLLVAGRSAVTGYKVNNDTVFHAIMPEYLSANGYDFSSKPADAFSEAAYDKFVTQGYPDGWHQVLLLAMKIWRRRAFALFNFTGAFFAALTAPVAFAWLRRAGLPLGWSLFGGLSAAAGSLQLTYLFQGFAPQAAVIPFIYAALLLFYEILIGGQRRAVPAAALLLQASVAVYSFTILLWLATFIAVLVIYALWQRGGPIDLKAGVSAAGLAIALGLLINPFTLVPVGAAFRMVAGWSAADTIGNLVSRRVPILPVFGIWLFSDHRTAPSGLLHWASYAGAFLVLLLLLRALKFKAGRPLLPVLMVVMTVPPLVLKIGASPYYFAKTLHVAAPAVAVGAVAGLYFIAAAGRRSRAALLATLYFLGVALSGLAAIIFVAPTPAARFGELLYINDRYAPLKSRGTLFLATGEDWGAYLLGQLRPVAPFALAYKGRAAPVVRGHLAGADIHDLDSLKRVLRYDLLVIDKKQDISLPPPLYELDYAGRFFNVYKSFRSRQAAGITEHRPFETLPGARQLSYKEVAPGSQAQIRLKDEFKSLFISAYLWPRASVTQPTQPVLFFAGGRAEPVYIGRLPSVYAVPLAADSGAVLRVKNTTPYLLRLDWVETVRRSHDQAALFRYNSKNKRVFQSIERVISR